MRRHAATADTFCIGATNIVPTTISVKVSLHACAPTFDLSLLGTAPVASVCARWAPALRTHSAASDMLSDTSGGHACQAAASALSTLGTHSIRSWTVEVHYFGARHIEEGWAERNHACTSSRISTDERSCTDCHLRCPYALHGCTNRLHEQRIGASTYQVPTPRPLCSQHALHATFWHQGDTMLSSSCRCPGHLHACESFTAHVQPRALCHHQCTLLLRHTMYATSRR